MTFKSIPAMAAHLDRTERPGAAYTVQDQEDQHGIWSGSFDECMDYMDAVAKAHGGGTFTLTNNKIGTSSIYNYS